MQASGGTRLSEPHVFRSLNVTFVERLVASSTNSWRTKASVLGKSQIRNLIEACDWYRIIAVVLIASDRETGTSAIWIPAYPHNLDCY